MIVCHEHRFIFVKTRKTGGTSVEVSLSRLTSPGDVVTPVIPRDEAVRAELGLAPMGYRGRFNPLPEVAFGSPREKFDALREFAKGKRFRNHSQGFKIRNRIGREIWDSYFKFCFERNPWDKTVSHYYWNAQKRAQRGLTLEQYLRRGKFPVDRGRWLRRGRMMVDFVGRFENLAEDLAKALGHVGVEFDGWLPKLKGGNRDPASRPYQRFLPAEARDAIGCAFRPEIERLGYRFDQLERAPRLTRQALEG